jgi:hypothetical protein
VTCRWALGLVLFAGLAHAQTPEERAVESIRREATAAAGGSAGNPLPLASGWSTARGGTGFAPAYQLDQLQRGQYLLPWFALWDEPKPEGSDEYPAPADALYYEPGVKYAAEHHLPLCFVAVEWEVLMKRVSEQYAKAGGDRKQLPLSPFDAVEPWYALGREWAHHGTLRRLERLYPNPPLVLFVQDSEYPRVSPYDLNARYSAQMNPDLISRRRAIGDAWIAKYQAMLRGFRENLESPAWQKNTVIVGYDQFADSAMGRWYDWAHDSLYIPGRTNPFPYAWDGASPSYGLHDFFPDTDGTVWSPQVEAMNWVGELEAVRRTKPDYWFEITTWDGQIPGQPSDKLRFFASRGQPFTPSRYGGMVQFGMWLLRPRVVREFRDPKDDRIHFEPYFAEILAAVARVHDDATLRAFWRRGRLLANPAAAHPYQENLPSDLAARQRWFLLDSSLNPARPWQLSTELKIFSLALERGQKPHREWLVFASSPLKDVARADVVIPGGPLVHVHAPPAGAFTLVSEDGNNTRAVGE